MPWSYHEEVAALPPEQQQEYLEIVAKKQRESDEFTREDFRQLLIEQGLRAPKAAEESGQKQDRAEAEPGSE